MGPTSPPAGAGSVAGVAPRQKSSLTRAFEELAREPKEPQVRHAPPPHAAPRTRTRANQTAGKISSEGTMVDTAPHPRVFPHHVFFRTLSSAHPSLACSAPLRWGPPRARASQPGVLLVSAFHWAAPRPRLQGAAKRHLAILPLPPKHSLACQQNRRCPGTPRTHGCRLYLPTAL